MGVEDQCSLGAKHAGWKFEGDWVSLLVRHLDGSRWIVLCICLWEHLVGVFDAE